MLSQSEVTIIIPTLLKDRTKEMEYAFNECHNSLLETVPDIKIIVAANGGSDCHGSFVHIFEQGQCKAVNAAVATTNTPWIFVTNDDHIYTPGWWEKLTTSTIPEMAKTGIYKDLLCISPRLAEPRPGAPTFLTEFCGGAGGDFDKQKWLEFASRYTGEGIVTGFNLPFLIKRELWDIIGGYDINYDPWGSNGDSDLQEKIHLAGVKTYQNTNCIVYHFAETSGTSSPLNHNYWQKNWDYFISKWGFERQPSSEKVWRSQEIIDRDRLIFHPKWEGYYGE